MSYIYTVLSQLSKSASCNICLVGDFNAKHSCWLPSQSTDGAGDKLFAFATINGLTQVVSDSTYTTTSGKDVLLDLMFVNHPQFVQSCFTLAPVADHCPTVLCLSTTGLHRARPKVYHIWDFQQANLSGLRDALLKQDWSELYRCVDPSEAVTLWSRLLNTVLHQHIPLKRVSNRRGRPWYSPYLHRLARVRDRLFRRSRGSAASAHTIATYKKVRNLYVHELRVAERHYFRNLASQLSFDSLKNRPHFWWSRLKDICGWQSTSSTPSLSEGTRLVSEPKAKAELLNSFFSKQCSNPFVSQVPLLPRSVSQGEEFVFAVIKEQEVSSVLKHLNTWKATGLDGLSTKILQACAVELAAPLAFLFNLSLSTGVYPDQWKEALVNPIYKGKGSKSLPGSYRPTSLLSNVSKVFGRLVKKQLLAFFLNDEVIPEEQFGFLPGRSTVWQLLQTLEEWHEALDNGSTVHALFLDVEKAFDRVDHGLLLAKLRSAGLSQPALEWVASYLDNRRICTTVDNVTSEFMPISSGVPQGSVLGPLLFLVYFSDLPCVVKSFAAMFADDTLLYDLNCDCPQAKAAVPSMCSVVSDATTLANWAKQWNTSFNASKSTDMVLSRHRKTNDPPPLVMDNVTISRSTTTKHLGVILCDKLTWNSHMKALISKIIPKVALLKWLAFRLHLPGFVISRVYLTMVRPSLEYAGAVWNSCRKEDAKTLEKIQTKIARIVLYLEGQRAKLSDSVVLEKLEWPTLAWRRRQSLLCLLWQLKHGLGPSKLAALLPAPTSVRAPYTLRKPDSIAFPLCTSQLHGKSFLPESIALWNALPANLQSSSSLPFFVVSSIVIFSQIALSLGCISFLVSLKETLHY